MIENIHSDNIYSLKNVQGASKLSFGMSHFKMVNYHFDPVSAHYASAELIFALFKEKDVELTAMSTPYKMNPPTPK